MTTSVKEGPVSAPAYGSKDTESTIAELRKSVGAIGEQLQVVVEKRGRQLKRGADAGADSLRRSIRRQPVLAVGVATLAGALLAIAVAPRAFRGHSASHWHWNSPISRADLHELADSIQRSVARVAGNVPLTSSLERMVDAITTARAETPAAFNVLAERVGAWLRRAQSSASGS